MNKTKQKRIRGGKITPFDFILSLFLVLLTSPVLIVALTIFILFREIVRIILLFKHGSDFDGFYDGCDAVYTVDEPAKSTISILYFIEVDKNIDYDAAYQIGYTICKKTAVDNNILAPKMNNGVHIFMGYSYKTKPKFDGEPCISKFPIVGSPNQSITQEQFSEILNDAFNRPLPKKNILWEARVGAQPIKLEKKLGEPGKLYFPLIFRVHHAVADGVALLRYLTNYCGSIPDSVNIIHPNNINVNEKKIETERITKKELDWNTASKLLSSWFHHGVGVLKNLLFTLYIIFVIPVCIYIQVTTRAFHDNKVRLDEKKTLVFDWDSDLEYIDKIKKIKSKIPGTSFTDVLLSAFSASISDYYHKSVRSPPKCISGAVPIVPGSTELRTLIPGCPQKSLAITNQFSTIVPLLPVLSPDETVCDALIQIKEDTHLLKRSPDFFVNRYTSILCGYLPRFIVKWILDLLRCTTVISMIAGPPNMNLLKNYNLKLLTFWSPHFRNIGMCFSSMTYGDRLFTMFSVDTALIPDKKDAKDILKGVFTKLDLLEKEIECLN